MSVEIVPVVAPHKFGWLPLWAGYLEFYQQTLTDAQTELTWERLVDPHENVHGFVAVQEGKLVGFTNYTFTSSTWDARPNIYLEDLFVDPTVRGAGIGRALIDAVSEVAREHGSRQVYWITHRDNTTARKLYDSLATLSEFVRYDRPVD